MRRPNLPLWLSPIWTHSDLFCSAWTSWNWLLPQHILHFCYCDISIIKLLVSFKFSLTLNCIIALFSLCDSLTTSQTLTEDSLTEYFPSTLPPCLSFSFQPLLLSTFMLKSMQCLGRYLPNINKLISSTPWKLMILHISRVFARNWDNLWAQN